MLAQMVFSALKLKSIVMVRWSVLTVVMRQKKPASIAIQRVEGHAIFHLSTEERSIMSARGKMHSGGTTVPGA